jgi:hypothetical protein
MEKIESHQHSRNNFFDNLRQRGHYQTLGVKYEIQWTYVIATQSSESVHCGNSFRGHRIDKNRIVMQLRSKNKI